MPGRSIAAILEDLLLNGISGSIDNSGAATLTEQQTQTTLLTRISNGAATRTETDIDKDNTNAVVTFPATANAYWQITSILASYSADPSSVRTLTITSTGADTAKTYITKAGPAPLDIQYVGSVNTDVVLTLQASGTGGTLGSLVASGRLIYS